MSNTTDTNQASEDEIVAILTNEYNYLNQRLNGGQNEEDAVAHYTDKLLAIIRTEKLKLLAEVRERVQVNQKGQFEEDSTGNVCWYLDDLVEALKEMEAEL